MEKIKSIWPTLYDLQSSEIYKEKEWTAESPSPKWVVFKECVYSFSDIRPERDQIQVYDTKWNTSSLPRKACLFYFPVSEKGLDTLLG